MLIKYATAYPIENRETSDVIAGTIETTKTLRGIPKMNYIEMYIYIYIL